MGAMRGGGRLLVVLGGELSDEIKKKRRGDVALSFDGFHCFVSRNNQQKINLIAGIQLGETAHRAMTMEE